MPRIFIKPLEIAYAYYHNKKRKIEYKKIEKEIGLNLSKESRKNF